jgi:putative nucleotidyltransferase with HDIG domain
MSFEPSLEEQELLADTFLRDGSTMGGRERVVELFVTLAFVAAVAALWVVHPPGQMALAPSALCLVVLIASAVVRIDTPFGFTVPTQLGFVPLLFAMPLVLVPIAVAFVLALVRLPDVFRGEMRLGRLLQSPGNAWFSIGPVAVFVVADVSPAHAGVLLLLAALAAQFLVDFVAAVFRFVVASGATLRSQLGETWPYVIDAALSGIALVVAERVRATPVAVLALLPLLGLLGIFARERHHRLSSLIELGNAYRGTALVLKDVIEADDGYTGEHSQSVVSLTMNLAERLELSVDRRRNLEFAALLHDVGKINIPKEIINKPGRLNAEEWAIIKTHTIEGQKMLDQVGGFMRDVGQIVRSHHERWDGGGYPDGLAGEDIPLEARIIACCDSWNAMRTNRVYRPALPFEVACGELTRNAGRQFDPHVVEVLIKMIEETQAAEEADEGPEVSPEDVAALAAEVNKATNGSSEVGITVEADEVSAGPLEVPAR